LELYNVPYGYIKGDAKYFGQTESINTTDGSNGALTFVSPLLIAVIFAGIAFIALVGRISAQHRDRSKKYV
jgi:hypothetical protein